MIRSIGDWIDTAMAWLKWPVAVVSLFVLPAAAVAALALLGEIAANFRSMLMFLAGAAAYLLLWMGMFRYSRFTFFLTLEHELTHALFAVLTFHRVTNLSVTASRGGVMGFRGRGNWLITTSPYFFPLLSVALIGVFWLLPPSYASLGKVLLGASFVYHITAMIRQTHPGQSDLQLVGFPFAFMFLPAANLIFSGLVLAYALNGSEQMVEFLGKVAHMTQSLTGRFSSPGAAPS